MSKDRSSSSQLLNEAIRILLVVGSLLVLLSLLSFDPASPSIDTSTGGEQHNWIGRVGNSMADLLLQFFGLAAFFIPLIVSIGGWRILKLGGLGMSLLRLNGFVILLLSLTALLAHPALAGSSLGFLHNVRGGNAGGIVGESLFHLLAAEIHNVGATIVWATLFILSAMGTLQISLEENVKRLHQEVGFFNWLYRFKDWRHKRAEERAAQPKQNPVTVTEPKPDLKGKVVPEAKPVPVATGKSKQNVGALSEETLNEINTPAPTNGPPPVIIKTTAAIPGEAKGPTKSMAISGANGHDEIPETVNEPGKPRGGNSKNGGTAGATPLTLNNTALVAESELKAGQTTTAKPKRPRIDIKAPTLEVPAIASEPESPVKDGGRDLAASASSKPKGRSSTRQEPVDEDEFDSAPHELVIEREPEARVMEVDELEPAEFETSVAPRREKPAKRPAARVGQYEIPPTEMLNSPELVHEMGEPELLELARQLEAKCAEFAVAGHVEHIRPGPVVTTFEFKPDPGVKYSRITGLVDDLCLAMRAESIRIDRLPGKSTVGIEVPNTQRATIYLRDVIESKAFQNNKSKLTIALGKTIGGEIFIADLTKMPHLLIAGATGAGKSVGLNSIVMSILYKATPDEVKFIMVDPKRLELGLYEGIPHLLTPIVTDPKRASYALRWTVNEMENRYRTLAGFGVRNIDQYNREINAEVDRRPGADAADLPRTLPYIVVVIDELADLMMVASNDVEASITRLAQMARAVGIHLVLATQRPSVDVITGLIKANFPSRIAFRVSSKVDSRTIIDSNGAEQLLGQGDMLFLPPGTSRLVRVHGSFVDEREIHKVMEQIKRQAEPTYDESITMSEKEAESTDGGMGERDEYYAEALRIVIQMGRASTSVLQRRLHIGYGRAAAILDQMEAEGLIGPSEGSKPREVKPEARLWLERVEQMENE